MGVKAVTWWRSSWAFGAWVVGVVLALHAATDAIGRLDRQFYDLTRSARPHQGADRVALIAVDEASIGSLGPWPWPRDTYARLIDKLAQARPKVVVLAVPFLEPQFAPGLVYLQQMKALLSQAHIPAPLPSTTPSAAPVLAPLADGTRLGSDALQQQLADLVHAAEVASDGDARLARSLQQSGNVLLAANATPVADATDAPQATSPTAPGVPQRALPAFILNSALEKPATLAWREVQLQFPIERLGTAAAGVGHVSGWPDADGVLRSEPLLLTSHGQVLPSLALLAAAHSLNLTAADIRLAAGPVLHLDRLRLATSASGAVLPQFFGAASGQPAFAADSFAEVLSGKIAAAKYADKVVMIGVTAPGVGHLLAVPGNPAMPSLQVLAGTTSDILQSQLAHEPPWAPWVFWVSTALAAAFVVWGLPALSAFASASLSVALVLSVLALEFWGLVAMGWWLQLVLPATLLLLGCTAHLLRRVVLARAPKPSATTESAQTDRMMGLALQGQGQLDMAFERFSRLPMHAALAPDLYFLAMDFERQQRFDKAQAVYAHIMQFDDAYKDVKDRWVRAQVLAGNADPAERLVHPLHKPLDGHLEKITLGRYEIDKELGKGAMGLVYLGTDPKIGRQVALKTMALGQEFEGHELVDARERFFREAKAAGRLQHPNIVTIFDAGEAHDLAYIAMEYIPGRDLQHHCTRGHLLPVPLVLSVVARVAQALAYAHNLGVIHRDIKPSNVMFDSVTDTVKVTDFGIARITDGNKTRTGIVMGTPSYMSPEQLTAMALDGRSDLYSLGIMLFQLLAGVLPFKADSMAELMSKIAKQVAPDIRQVRPELPQAIADIVARLLRKSPQDRYQDGAVLAADLSADTGPRPQGQTVPVGAAPRRPGPMTAGSIDLER